MSRYIRTAGSSGGGAYSDGSVCALLCNGAPSAMGVCCIRTQWETLYQCDATDGTNFGCCIEFTVDATKYRGFKLHMNGFCGPVCGNCQIYVGVGDSDCYCCCSNSAYFNCIQCTAASFQTGCLNQIFGGGGLTQQLCCANRMEVEFIASSATEKNWRGYQRVFEHNAGHRENVMTSNLVCGTRWCDITRIKFWQSASQGMVAREGAYLAVFGLKTPTCSISFNATLTDMS